MQGCCLGLTLGLHGLALHDRVTLAFVSMVSIVKIIILGIAAASKRMHSFMFH